MPKKVRLTLAGIDGNAYHIIGCFLRQAKKQGWTNPEIEKVITEARSSNYEHLVYTIAANCEDEEDK